jgi:hypothetical protein
MSIEFYGVPLRVLGARSCYDYVVFVEWTAVVWGLQYSQSVMT